MFYLSTQAVSGRYVNQTFDPATGNFSVTFVADLRVSDYPTVIHVNEKYYYPNGLTVRSVCMRAHVCVHVHVCV